MSCRVRASRCRPTQVAVQCYIFICIIISSNHIINSHTTTTTNTNYVCIYIYIYILFRPTQVRSTGDQVPKARHARGQRRLGGWKVALPSLIARKLTPTPRATTSEVSSEVFPFRGCRKISISFYWQYNPKALRTTTSEVFLLLGRKKLGTRCRRILDSDSTWTLVYRKAPEAACRAASSRSRSSTPRSRRTPPPPRCLTLRAAFVNNIRTRCRHITYNMCHAYDHAYVSNTHKHINTD